jgi:two-component system, NtrC family, sensor kinase
MEPAANAAAAASAEEAVDGAVSSRLVEQVNAAKLESLGMLVAGIAHELNTPMGAIHSNHDVLKHALARLQEVLADERVEADELAEVRRIVTAVDGVLRVNELAVTRMARLIRSLRTFGRLDPAEIDTVDLHEGIESTLALLAAELRGRVEVVREYGSLPRVQCFPHQLNQVFMNLLVNASQAIPDRGWVAVRTGTHPGGVFVRVQDSGIGIPRTALSRIFEPGFSTKAGRVGMGMGLLIVQQIVEAHGGHIEVSSDVGRGTTFTVYLPLSLPESAVKEGFALRMSSHPDSGPSQDL